MTDAVSNPAAREHRWVSLRLVVLCIVTLALMLHPVANRWTRGGVVVLVAACWIWFIRIAWKQRWLRNALIGLPLLLLLFAIAPGFDYSRPSLRDSYIASLRRYEGTRYIWGGENSFGVDCSGLVRSALINACVRESFQTANPALLRSALNLWWHDCPARALGAEYRDQTLLVTRAEAINDIPTGRLQPGDLAVTQDGVHVLAYLGGNEWVEADPDARRVLVLTTPSTNAWFSSPVNIVCWSALLRSR